ncbi:MAG: hypothetical protein KF683_09750 [Rubrivivax sp.]|nr:hypothetical protein [Rubrivivax sp.]
MSTRKEFLAQMAGGGLLLALGGCGGGGGGSESSAAPRAGCLRFTFTANHGHELVIPTADLDSTSARTYSVQGSGPHDHLVTITAAQFAALKAGQAIAATTTEGGLAPAHTHDMAGTCA